MGSELKAARENFIQALSDISHLGGFSQELGAIFGTIYLSPQPISGDELRKQSGFSQEMINHCLLRLERLGMVFRRAQAGDDQDFYVAETDFWQIVRTLLGEREKSTFDQAVRSMGESTTMLAKAAPEEAELAQFYQERIQAVQRFLVRLDKLVTAVLALENLRQGKPNINRTES